MRNIRILVVDDSVTFRLLLRTAISSEPGLEVAGVAPNGRIALERVEQLNPDLVTLDMEMPELDGLQTLAAIRKVRPALPVIMISSLTQRGAAATLDALSLGASDYVTKPVNAGSSSQAAQSIREQLIPKIRVFCGVEAAHLPLTPPHGAQKVLCPALRGTPMPGRVEIVAIGLSTGGPNALSEIVPTFAGDFPVPIVIVQHMPPVFTKYLAERLGARSRVRVEEGSPGQSLTPGAAWIAPGDFHMEVESNKGTVSLKTHQAPPENSCRPAVDVLFRSVAKVYGPHALGVIMTGMGQDGLRGCEYIRESGGRVLAQDEASSVVWGMPGFVAKAGLANKVVPLGRMGAQINCMVNEGRALPSLSATALIEANAP